MKKLMFILPLLSLVGLTSCETNHKEEVTPFKTKEVKTYVDINNEELKSLVSSNQEFILFVYQNGCMGCKVAEKYIEKFVEETDVLFYGISYYQYSKVQNGTLNYPKVNYTPTFFFYEDGKVFDSFDRIYPESDNGYKKFYKKIDESVDLDSKIYTLNKFDYKEYELEGNKVSYYETNLQSTDVLDRTIANNSSVNIIMHWNKCGDCKSLFNNYIYNGRLDKLKEPLYIFDTFYYRENKPPKKSDDEDNYKLWLDFATKYGFSSYYDGKVPSLVHFERGKPTEFIVYANEGKIESTNNMYHFPNAQLQEVRELRKENEEELLSSAREIELREYDRLLNL